jgi:hypothetical protein
MFPLSGRLARSLIAGSNVRTVSLQVLLRMSFYNLPPGTSRPIAVLPY